MSEAPTPTPKPIACIRSGSIGNYTLCARSVSDKEFLFTDAGYAVMHYDPRGNSGTPRMVFDAVQVDGPKLPAFYAEGMELGYNLDADVSI